MGSQSSVDSPLVFWPQISSPAVDLTVVKASLLQTTPMAVAVGTTWAKEQWPHHFLNSEASSLAKMAEASISSSSSCPNQPRSKDFSYPVREFEKIKVVRRSFQDNWYDSCSWLDYDESKDAVYCYVCRLANS